MLLHPRPPQKPRVHRRSAGAWSALADVLALGAEVVHAVPEPLPMTLRRASHVLRVAFAVFAATVVWLAAGDAHASAPQCDERGATTFAKNPLLEVQRASVDVGDCGAPASDVDDLAYEEGRGSLPDFSGGTPAVALPAPLAFVAPHGALVPRAPSADDPGPRGARSTVDRPPRS